METQEYNKKYYLKHRVRISAKRKNQWRVDPEYRQQIQKRRQLYLARKKAACADLPQAKRGRRYPNTPRVIRRAGVVEFVYSTGATASRLGVKYPTLRGWAIRGLIPTIADKRGRYWFVETDIRQMVQIRRGIVAEADVCGNAAVKTVVYRRHLERHYGGKGEEGS
jgi:hypothetical protein